VQALNDNVVVTNKRARSRNRIAGTNDVTKRTSRTSRVLIHGINYAPELIGVGRYTRDFAEYLAEHGCAVEVITAVPHYPGWWVRPPFSNFRYWIETTNGVRIIRCPLLLHRSGRGLWRLLIPLSFAVAAAPVVLWRILRSRPQIVLIVEPTLLSAPSAILAAKIVGARRVLHVHDLEVEAAFAVGHLSNGVLRRLAEALDRFLIRRFHVIVTLSDRMRDSIVKKRPKAARVEVIRNWVDMRNIRPVKGSNSFRQELGLKEDDFVVLYAGQIGPKQSLHLVFEAVEQVGTDSRIHFVVAGEGALKTEFEQRYGGRPNVHFLPLQPEERLNELLNLANLHVLPQHRGASDLVPPSKLGGMLLATERPVLVTADQDTELYYLLKDVAILVPSGDAAALARGILLATRFEQDPARAREIANLFSRERDLLALREVVCS
jgi:colanic acid biosynthesis glycosyl transferase WcaI